MHGKIRNDSQLYVHCKKSNMHGNISNHIKTIKLGKNRYTYEEIKLIPDNFIFNNLNQKIRPIN